MSKSLIIKFLGITFCLCISFTHAQALSPDQIFNKVKNSIVVVKTLNRYNNVTTQGSGVLLPSGKIATNCHVVAGGASFLVGSGTNLVPATLYAEDTDKDICILDTKYNTGKPVQLGKASNLKVGVPVYAVGAPKGLELSISDGIVAQLRGGKPPLIQTTASISPGSSGGGLFNQEGQLVGLTTLYIEGGQSLNFAMPAEWINEVKPVRKAIAENERRNNKQGHPNEKDDVFADFDKIYINPNNEHSLSMRAAFNLDFGRYDKAIDDLDRAIKLKPNNATYYTLRGLTYAKLGKYDKSIKDLNNAVKLEPTFSEHYYCRARAYSMSGNINNAIQDLDKAIQLDPNRRNSAKTQKDFNNIRKNSEFKRLIGE